MTYEEYQRLYNTKANNRCDGHQDKHYGFWMQQHPDEFWRLIEELNSIAPKKILEIGTNHGGSTVFWDHLAGAGGKVVSMDACGHQGNIMSMFRPEFCDYSPVSEFYLIDGSSHSEETLAAVKEVFQGPLDFLFIDGDHTYEGALLDYQMYGPLVRSGGIIAVDDINMDVRVGRAWDEMVALGGERKMTSDAPKALGIIRLP